MAKPYILSIDQGTTSTKVLILDASLRIRGRASREFPQRFPKPGWVEHDPETIWRSVLSAIRAALRQAKLRGGQIAAIGITNQRETTLLWDRDSGAAPTPAIVWQDRRTSDRCKELQEAGLEAKIRSKTGLVIDPYFSATKLEWMLRKKRGLMRKAESGALAFGTVDSFLIHRLSGGAAHVTDVSNASRTLLMNLRRLTWDDELLELFSIPKALLPEIRPSSAVVASTKGVPGLPDGIPIAGIAGDQQAALFGQACFSWGDSKCTYGTGAFLLMNTGPKPVRSKAGLLSTVAWKLGEDEVSYALEGSSFVAGAAIQWLRDGLGLIRRSADIDPLAASVKDTGGVVFVPALAGLGAPRWRPDARGLLSGLDRGTTKAHVARAVLEGIAFEIRDLAVAMERDTGSRIRSFTVDGGASASDLLMQIQADLLGRQVVRPENLETTAFGAAFLAGLGVGIWSSKEEIRESWKEDRRFRPQIGPKAREAAVARWEAAVEKA